ncbi:MAG: RnfABCDGE type electron transport complex subunit B [Desulfobacterales bacterium]|nr:RnfABCDGE type electron transport complex subunit B [Desulfobacterales bacterium]
MFEAILMMGGLGIIIGSCLALASKVFYVYVDPKVVEIDELLPGANCGGCGYPGCGANAEAVVAGESPPTSCVAGSAELAEQIAAVLGLSIEAKEPDIARPGCTYGVDEAALKYRYQGLSKCQAAAMLYGGMKECHIGCLGLGSCMTACPFDAITMGEDHLPKVDENKCTGCGTCERVCPKNIIKLSSVTRRILKEYTTEYCTTPCQRACPAGINICEYIRQITLGDYHKSVQVIKERNPFPTVIGRICPRPCETECRRNLADEPVAINYLKRFVADYERETGTRVQPYKAPATHRSIAVIGGGAAGLSTAFFAARLGHAPTVFEATDQAGGLLRTAIAQYRLPPEILDWDIDGILEMGVTMQTNRVLGRDYTLAGLLRKGYEAVYLAAGGWDSRIERIKDAPMEEAIPGTYLLIDLMKTGLDNKSRLKIKSDMVLTDTGPLTEEAINICRHLGAENITILCQASRDKAGIAEAAIDSLEAEGVHFVFNSAVASLVGEEDRLTGIESIALTSRETRIIPAETLILESGRLPELIFTVPQPETDGETPAETPEAEAKTAGPLKWIGIPPTKNPIDGKRSIGLLSSADAVTDFSAAIRAIAAGRRAAAAIHKRMYGIELDLPAHVISCDTMLQTVSRLDEEISPAARQIMPMCRVTDVPAYCREIEKGFTEEMAREEANRCLQCGVICYSGAEAAG